MSSVPENVWTGTGWVRNPALPPLPEPAPVVPTPGYYGGSFVPHNVTTTIPNAAIQRNPPPPGLGVHASPSLPIAIQHSIPAPIIPPPALLAAAILAGMPHPTGLPQPGLVAPPPPAPPLPSESALEFADAPPVSATMLVPAEAPRPVAMAAPVPVPPPPPDPIAEQIVKARAAAQSGKL